MEKNLSKAERIKEKERLSNVVTGKMSAVFVALVAALMLIFFCERKGISLALVTGINIAQVVTAVLTALALVRCIFSIRKGSDTRYKVFSPIFTLGLCASAFFMSSMYLTIDATYTILALIAFAVLFFVYEIYPVDFFICTASVFAGCITAAVVDRPSITFVKDILVMAVYVAVVAICAIASYTLVKKGKIRFGKKTVKKPREMLFAAVIASIAVSLIAAFGVLFFGYLLYFVAAACVAYFVIAIIYTVKLM